MEYLLDLCARCAQEVFGFRLKRMSNQMTEKRCAFCQKKTTTLPYMVEAITERDDNHS